MGGQLSLDFNYVLQTQVSAALDLTGAGTGFPPPLTPSDVLPGAGPILPQFVQPLPAAPLRQAGGRGKVGRQHPLV